MNRGCSGSSLSAWRILRTAVLMPCSVSTKTSLPQRRSTISWRVTTLPCRSRRRISSSIGMRSREMRSLFWARPWRRNSKLEQSSWNSANLYCVSDIPLNPEAQNYNIAGGGAAKGFDVNWLGLQVSSLNLHLAVLVIFGHLRQDAARSSKKSSSCELFEQNFKEMIYENRFQDVPCGTELRVDGSLLDRDGRRPVWHSDGKTS